MTDRKAYQQKAQAHLNEWKAELDRLRAKVQGMEADARIEFDRQLSEIRRRFDTVHEKVSGLIEAGNDGYEKARGTVDTALTEFTKVFDEFKRKISDREPALR